MTILILGALSAEITTIEPQIEEPREQVVEGLRFTVGQLHGMPAVVGCTGVGKVNAALVTALALVHFRPTGVICTGVAGGVNPELIPGDVVIARRTAQHDYGRWYTNGYMPLAPLRADFSERHPPFFLADDYLLAAAHVAATEAVLDQVPSHANDRPPRIIDGVIVTGDLFAVARSKREEIRARFAADACEMESAAIAQVCAQFGVPCLVVRGISDISEDIDIIPLQDLAVAAENAARLVVHALGRLE